VTDWNAGLVRTLYSRWVAACSPAALSRFAPIVQTSVHEAVDSLVKTVLDFSGLRLAVAFGESSHLCQLRRPRPFNLLFLRMSMLTNVEPQELHSVHLQQANPMGTYVRPVAPMFLLAALGAMFSACSHSSPTAPSTSSITVTGTVPVVGQTSQLTAKATLSNGTIQDVTALSTWSSSNPAVATVTSGGLLRVTQLGAADITATYQGMSGKLSWSLQVTISGTVPPPFRGCDNASSPSCPTAGLPTLTFNGPSASFAANEGGNIIGDLYDYIVRNWLPGQFS